MKKEDVLSNIFKKRVTCLLYLIMRDHLPLGKVEKIIQDLEKYEDFELSNKDLESYAKKIIIRLDEPLTSLTMEQEK